MNKTNFYYEKDENSFLKNLKLNYKDLIQGKIEERKVLISKKNLKDDKLCYDYKDETSCIVYKKEEYENICILDIPTSFYYYFIGKSGVMKIKYEYEYCVNITEISSDREIFTILVDGIGKEKFKYFVLDLIFK